VSTNKGTGHSEYKQRFSGACSDSSLCLTSPFPIQLFTSSSKEETTVLWQNPRPSPARYCRPVRLQFRKETTDSTREEKKSSSKIKLLRRNRVVVVGQQYFVSNETVDTVVDGRCVVMSLQLRQLKYARYAQHRLRK